MTTPTMSEAEVVVTLCLAKQIVTRDERRGLFSPIQRLAKLALVLAQEEHHGTRKYPGSTECHGDVEAAR